MIHIFFHSSDMDGHCSGAISKYFYTEIKNKPVKMYPINYEDKFPWEEIKKDDKVVMVDFAIKPNYDMKILNSKCDLVWIDHHKSAIDTVNKVTKIKGLQSTKYAGCELTWKVFFPNIPIPEFVKLLGRYDVWDESDKNRWKDEILPFQFGIKGFRTNPARPDNKVLLDLTRKAVNGLSTREFLRDTIDTGKRIKTYQENIDESYMESLVYYVEFEGYRCIVANYRGNSNSFKSVWNPDKHDIMLMYYNMIRDNKSIYTVSLYTTKDIDCGQIAKKYGGGGHPQAAGFQTEDLPWLIENKKEGFL